MPQPKVYKTSKTNTSANEESVQVVQNGWEPILEDVEMRLKQAQARVRSLKICIRQIRAKLEAGEPFPVALQTNRRSRRAAASTHN